MATVTLLKILAGMCIFGAVFFAGEWLRSLWAIRNMNYLDRESLKMREETRKERNSRGKNVLYKLTDPFKGMGDTQAVIVAFLFMYIGVSSTLGIVLGASLQTLLLSVPLTIVGVLLADNYNKKRRRAKGAAQVLNVLRLTISYLENGSPPNIALNRAANAVENPLREDILACLNSMVGTMGLGEAMKPLAALYPSAATRLLVSALEVNDAQGSHLVPVLRQAENSARRRIELSAEATAEVAEAKTQFIGVTIVTALIAFSLLGNSAEAYSGVGPVTVISLGVMNYLWGVIRILKVFNKAKAGLE